MSAPSVSRVRRAVLLFIIGVVVCLGGGLAEAQFVRVFVVPFLNVSGQPSDAWIGTGIAETVAADLQTAGLMVDRGYTTLSANDAFDRFWR